eukprot:m.39367 g.39367  ORF g.39367 m.39367 type:complete len:118 (+) comp9543_c0_seq1:221-574(+)
MPLKKASLYDDASVPLFGEDDTKTRAADLLFGIVTLVTVAVTIGLSFSQGGSIDKLKIFFGVVIILLSFPQIVLVKWFRDGDLHPKFRYLIGYMMCSIVLLCVCATVYFYRYRNECP